MAWPRWSDQRGASAEGDPAHGYLGAVVGVRVHAGPHASTPGTRKRASLEAVNSYGWLVGTAHRPPKGERRAWAVKGPLAPLGRPTPGFSTPN